LNSISFLLIAVLGFVLMIGPLVFLHELGHYLAGRRFGVKAEEFAIGFGREVAGFTDKRGTRWKFGWLPLGGYVRFAGDMNPASQPSPEWLALPPAERAQTFQAKKLWQRAIIVFAGPFANFIVALVIFSALFLAYGNPVAPTVIGGVVEGGPAAVAGMQQGDRITAIDGRRVSDFKDLADYVKIRPDGRFSIDYERGGAAMRADVAAGLRIEKDRFGNTYRFGVLGVKSGPVELRSVSVIEAPGLAVGKTIGAVQMMIDGVGLIISGRRPISELGGPLRIAQVAGERFSLGFVEFIYLMAFISINLGFINLLPVPVLDGGHLLSYAIEGIRRRPVEPQVMEWAFRGGLVAILALMVLVTFNDLGAFGVWRNLAGLIG
jgi:regulator of sigma E protease